jgi:lipoprotein-anchoring transpeptidase ErfK/SrfK
MPLRSPVCSIALASLAAIASLAPTTASAQGLIDFLWGGTSEWGGGRQTVAFDPKYTSGQIIVSFGDRRLYHITAKGRATSYPIAIPREQSRWQGTTTVSAKRENPSWRPTPDMLKENPRLPSWVPGGHPMNPLGVRALYLGSSTYRIHGTDAPWTIGQDVSKGCIRMYNEDVLDLYPRVAVGTRVTVTWERFNTQYVASGANMDSGPASYALSGYKQPTVRRKVRALPPLPVSDEVGEAQTEAVRASFTRPSPATAALDEEPAASERKAAKHDKPTHDKPAKDKKQAKSKDSAPGAEQPATEKLPTVAAVEAAEKKHKPQQPAEAAAGASSAADAARRAAAAAAKAAEAARKAAEAAKKAAEDAKRATSSGTGASEESPAPTDKRASL